MTEVKTSSRLFIILAAMAVLSACGAMNGFGTQETVAMADQDDVAVLGPVETETGIAPYMRGGAPISSTHPVRGLDDD